MYVISAIKPSRINMETLLIEVDRIGVRECFSELTDDIVIKDGYARYGNFIICGYDKAETLKKVMLEDTKTSLDDNSNVILFDDEYVNIENFMNILPGCSCYWISTAKY